MLILKGKGAIGLLKRLTICVVGMGIDANDSLKTSATLRYMTSFLLHVPLVPIDYHLTDVSPTEQEEEEREDKIELSTAFYDIAHTFLDAILVFVSHLEKPQVSNFFFSPLRDFS